MADYDDKGIEVLSGLEAVRKRPAMYLGDLHDGSALCNMLFEVVGNVIDQHLMGRVSGLRVELRPGEALVVDDGTGISPDPRQSGQSNQVRLLTILHHGATWDEHFPHVHIGEAPRALGLAPVNALSAELELQTDYAGRRYRIICRKGNLESEDELGESTGRGTSLRFRPDPTIFPSTEWNVPLIRGQLWELACLNPALTIDFQHDGHSEVFRATGGLVDFVRAECAGRGLFVSPLRLVGAHDDALVEIAVQWGERGRPSVHGFVNQQRTREGTHVEGLWDGLCDAWTEERGDESLMSPRVLREVLGDGMTAAVHVALYAPRFGAPTRDLLVSPEGRRACYAIARDGFRRVLRNRKGSLRTLFEKRFDAVGR